MVVVLIPADIIVHTERPVQLVAWEVRNVHLVEVDMDHYGQWEGVEQLESFGDKPVEYVEHIVVAIPYQIANI